MEEIKDHFIYVYNIEVRWLLSALKQVLQMFLVFNFIGVFGIQPTSFYFQFIEYLVYISI